MVRTFSRASIAVLGIALLLVPSLAVQAHDEGGMPDDRDEVDPRLAPPNRGYTGPSSLPWLSFYEGIWVYGQFREIKLGNQVPQNVRGDGDWLVWEDARRGDIFLFSVGAGEGFYITADGVPQRNPDIQGGTVVWEDYRDGPAKIYAYEIDSGETRRVSGGPGNHRRPSLDGPLVAWEDDRDKAFDIWGAWLTNGTTFPVVRSPDRESDPLVVKGSIYYRTYRFSVWDILAYDVERNRTTAVTNDAVINGAPFSNGKDVYFLSQAYNVAWELQRYDVAEGRVRSTGINLVDTARTPISGDRLLQVARDGGYSQVVARNITTTGTNHISGNLKLVTDPELIGRTAFFMVQTFNGTSLLMVEVSDFAFAKRPELLITGPSTGAFWTRPVKVQGYLKAGTTFREPDTFTYRVNGGPPRAIPPSQAWSFTLDPEGYKPGNHQVTVRATFSDGPPTEASTTLVVPSTTSGLDIEKQAEYFHRAQVFFAYNKYIGQNAAAWILLPLLLLILLVVVVRLILVIRANRRDVRIEFVRP